MKIAVTGAGGFIGRRLMVHLAQQGHDLRQISRAELSQPDFSDIECVIHCAGIAHKNTFDLTQLNAINHLLPLNLAEEARDSGVKRFIFVSTINVVAGNPSPLTINMPYNPLSSYGQSKALAEQGLLKMQGIDVVIARPALVYGAGAPGNLRSLLRLCNSGLPLPFGRAENKRSFVALENVVRALEFMVQADSSRIAGKIFHLADPLPISTKQLVTNLRQRMSRPSRLVPVPRLLMKTGLTLLGKKALYQQLFEDLIIDGHDLKNAGFIYENGQADIAAMVDMYLKKKAG